MVYAVFRVLFRLVYLMFFFSVVDEVLKREHKFGSKPLHVEVYYKQIGPPAGALSRKTLPPDTSAPSAKTEVKPAKVDSKKGYQDSPKRELPKLPDNFDEQCDAMVAKFITRNEKLRRVIETDLNKLHCQVLWPKSSDCSNVQLQCSLDLQKADDLQAVDGWTTECSQVFRSHVDSIKCDTLRVPPEIWTQFKGWLDIQIDSDDDDISCEVDNGEVHFVGTAKKVEKLSKNADAYLKLLVTVAPQTCQEQMVLKEHEIEWLVLSGFEEQLKNRYRSSRIEFKVSVNTSTVHLSGSSSDVDDAKVLLH
jgi:hypothetical protein